ncbi:hypothetical protein UFOVP1204_54 [uncultured Caudovirales phage]|uniref:Uncharacterized protein n=1 Tax=uncultured Caudovirales phage TaxID=2100421 RepID=A0A6J5RF43_9CAUD|nr:hypothetical protein UFOVP473_47 [uncultured Caudovirales phage]CAB4176705.1 hypothetical protein UFOVP983_47 [uncultured Caudovirales phage]CAB4190234.1 hypothetical protein UFOVP1204_54 [uncultured Caudovirales phage]
MISPWTKPGTKVVCVESDGSGHGGPYLGVGQVYTVKEMYKTPDGRVGVDICEYDHDRLTRAVWWKFWQPKCKFSFARKLFNPLELPKSITSLLNTAPVDDKVSA